MKKFKNSICVQGTHILIEAFAKELLNLGYKDCTIDRVNFISCTTYNSKDGINDSFFNCRDSYDKTLGMSGAIHLVLPQDWNRALELASELEEEMPEYVEITDGFGCWYKTGEIYKIYHADTKPGYLAYYNHPTDRAYWIDSKQAKVISKEVYDKQQQELADKELLEKLIKESDLKIGDTIKTLTFGKGIIREFYLINSSKSAEERSYSVQEEWKKTYKPFLAIKFDNSSVPVNKVEKLPETKTLTLGSSNIEIKISKGKIEAVGQDVYFHHLDALVKAMQLYRTLGDWKVSFPSVKIGCSTFTLAELEQIVETYNELNK